MNFEELKEHCTNMGCSILNIKGRYLVTNIDKEALLRCMHSLTGVHMCYKTIRFDNKFNAFITYVEM